MNVALLLWTLCVAPAAPQADLPAGATADEIVRLRDGRMLVGAIEEHDLDGFLLVLARTGGRLRLGWSDLFPGEAERLRSALGYANQTAVPTTTAHRILLRNGREIVGRITRQDSRGIEVRTLESTLLVPADMVAAPPEEILVAATAVLTPEQFYLERVSTVAPGDAYANFLFAQELAQIFALDRAKEHFTLAGTLAAAQGDAPLLTRVTGALQQLEETIVNRAEALALEQIRRAMYRERFEEAEALLDAFATQFPSPKLRVAYSKAKAAFVGERNQAITRYLARTWFDRVVAQVKRRALDREATMDQLLAWVEGELPLAVRASLVEELKTMNDELDPFALDPLWRERASQGAVRHRASFGEGTWILGEERARAGMEDPAAKEAEDGKTAAQREMDERMQRYLANLEAQRRTAAGAENEGEATPDDWWLQASVTERFQFLLAYYAEYSGDYQMTVVEFTACSTCAGSGVLESVEISAQGAQHRRQRCPTCHGVGVRRALNFR